MDGRLEADVTRSIEADLATAVGEVVQARP
jgi:hypothetical protein